MFRYTEISMCGKHGTSANRISATYLHSSGKDRIPLVCQKYFTHPGINIILCLINYIMMKNLKFNRFSVDAMCFVAENLIKTHSLKIHKVLSMFAQIL